MSPVQKIIRIGKNTVSEMHYEHIEIFPKKKRKLDYRMVLILTQIFTKKEKKLNY